MDDGAAAELARRLVTLMLVEPVPFQGVLAGGVVRTELALEPPDILMLAEHVPFQGVLAAGGIQTELALEPISPPIIVVHSTLMSVQHRVIAVHAATLITFVLFVLVELPRVIREFPLGLGLEVAYEAGMFDAKVLCVDVYLKAGMRIRKFFPRIRIRLSRKKIPDLT